MKPLFYLLLVICFSTIFSCKKEKIAQTPTPASPTTIVPNATEQQLVGVWRYVKSEFYYDNVLMFSADSTGDNYFDSIYYNSTSNDYIEFTNVNNFNIPQLNYMFYNYNRLSASVFFQNAFYVTLAGNTNPTDLVINTSTYDSFNNLCPAWPYGGAGVAFYLPNPPTTNQMTTYYNYPPSATKYIRVLDAHNLVVSSWGNNYASGEMVYLCR